VALLYSLYPLLSPTNVRNCIVAQQPRRESTILIKRNTFCSVWKL
jgi:hypothetical protein